MSYKMKISDFREAAKNDFVEKIFISHPGGGWIYLDEKNDEKWIITVLFTKEFERWISYITHDDNEDEVMFFDTIDDAFRALEKMFDGLVWPCRVVIPQCGYFPDELEVPF